MKPHLLSWEETLFRDQDVFDLNYVPEQFDYRDEQTQALVFAIRPALRGGKILDTVCRGPPGTGKTTSVKKIFESLQETTQLIVPVHVNCRIDSSEYAVFTRIYTSLTKRSPPPSGTSVKQIIDMIAKYLEQEPVHPLVCLDDANYLIYENQFNKVLYPLLRMHEIFPDISFGLIVIISDPGIDLQNSLEVRVQSTFHPEIIQFPPYSAREIAGILNERIKQGLYPKVLSPELLDVIVDLVMKHGDVRLGLDLIKRSVLYAEKAARRAVTEEDVEKALTASRDMHLEMLISTLADDERLVLKTAAELFSEKTSPTTREIQDALPKNGPKLTRISEIFKRLDRLRLIDLEYSNQGGGRRRYVHLHEERDIILSLLSRLE
ncbi:MAG: ORC1-type DNA replication protein [Methanocorpusculum parvum]|nr:ORC1-type DNA replication protein [Methanocorpusculum parvum]